ncbi:ABC transporter ATP-binding protein [Amycolatopsis jejuensis]|uniref:ABC transporter ATP-binding protein n=1 Tax=Amycolatopsis jejuensis TaxID=330084 RepID=UPI00052568E3|nr:ABC transporter ATP-binding protein [Amycolatopsis jejuensis]
MAGLIVSSIEAGYHRGPAVVHDLSLTVQPGEILAVVGRNGAGKTTLLRALSGLLPCRKGTVRLDGRDLTGLPAHRVARRGMAHVPAGRRVIPGMSTLDNLKLGGYQHTGSAALASAVDEVLTMLPALAKWGARRAGTLSGGEQQLLAIGRALMSRPVALLLDEPLTGLSPAYQLDVLGELAKIAKGGTAILLVEQNVRKSLRIAGRGMVLDEGRVVTTGTPEELLTQQRLEDGYLGVGA